MDVAYNRELFAKSKIQIDLTLINFQFIISLTVFIIRLFHLFIYLFLIDSATVNYLLPLLLALCSSCSTFVSLIASDAGPKEQRKS